MIGAGPRPAAQRRSNPNWSPQRQRGVELGKLAGPYKWTWFRSTPDIYSRYVVGWLASPKAHRRCRLHPRCQPGQLTLRRSGQLNDVNSSLTSVPPIPLQAAPVQRQPLRAQFKTLKYSPTFPKRFANIATAIVLRRVLRALQPSPPLRYRPQHPRQRPLRPRRRRAPETPRSPRHRLHQPTGPLPQFPRPPGSTHPRRNPSPSEQPVSHSY